MTQTTRTPADADARRLLAAINKLVEHLIDEGHDAREPLLGLVDAIADKIDAAVVAIEAAQPAIGGN